MPIHTNQFKPLHRHFPGVVRHSVRRIAHQTGGHLPCSGNHLIQLLHLSAQRSVDLCLLLTGQGLALHQFVHIQAVALGRRDASRRGVGLLQIPHLHQIRQFVAHGGRADLSGHLIYNGFGAHRLGSGNVALHHDLQYLFFPIGQFHVNLLFSTPFP